jgi:hypothetical protein
VACASTTYYRCSRRTTQGILDFRTLELYTLYTHVYEYWVPGNHTARTLKLFTNVKGHHVCTGTQLL